MNTQSDLPSPVASPWAAAQTDWQPQLHPQPRPRQRGRWVVALALLLVVALPLLALGGYQVAYAGRIFPGVRALDVDLGGWPAGEAEAALAARVAADRAAPVTLVAAEIQRTATWGELGFQPDPRALVDSARAVGRTGDPLRRLAAQWDAATQGRSVQAPDVLDAAALERDLQAVADAVDRPVRDARLLVQPDASVEYTSAQTGRRLDVVAATAVVRAARGSGQDAVVLPVEETAPRTPDSLRTEAREYVERLLAGPVTLSYETREWTVTPRELVEWLEFEGGAGERLIARLDPASVRRRVSALAAELDRPAQEARLAWNGGTLAVTRPSGEGRKLNAPATEQLLVERAVSTDRTVRLPVDVMVPVVRADNVASLGIRELVEESRTTFAGSVPEKVHNIRLAAERLNGAVVPAGALFSFNQEVGPTTLAAGFQWGFGITSGTEGLRTVPSVAGGICQVATTLFQSFFWGGYRLEERHWHLYWIPAYTSRDVVGLDATVDEESNLDLQFVNTTPHAVLIEASTDDTSITFRLYSTKPAWEVRVAPAEITNRKPADPTPLVEEDPTLAAGRRVAVETAREGFDVLLVRTVTEASDVRTLQLKSTYQPSRNVTLVGTGGASRAGRASDSDQNRPVADRARE